MIRLWRYWRDRFYAGPRFLGIEPPRRHGYQSPTVTAALWGYAAVVVHFTLAGRVVFICTGLITLYAASSLLMPIHLLAFALLCLFALNVAIGFLLQPRVELDRRLPARVSAGTVLTVDYELHNRGRLPAFDVSVDTLPYPRGLRLVRGRAFVRELAPGGRVRVQTALEAGRRGRYRLPAPRADSAFPFHLWRWGVTATAAQTVVVYPGFTPLSALAVSAGRRHQPGGIALSSKVGDSMEFHGCREFRDGDDPRRLHWRSWARTGSPVVKEFVEEYFCRTALIVDTRRPRPAWLHLHWAPPPDRVFEAGLSLAAAIADFLAGRDYVVDLFAAGPEVYRFQGGRSLAYLENILDILACLHPYRGEPFERFSAELISELARISSTVFVLLSWDETRRRLLDAIADAGVSVRAFLVVDGAVVPDGLPPVVQPLSVADIVDGRAVAL